MGEDKIINLTRDFIRDFFRICSIKIRSTQWLITNGWISNAVVKVKDDYLFSTHSPTLTLKKKRLLKNGKNV